MPTLQKKNKMEKESLQLYKEHFVRNYHTPYIIQPLNDRWRRIKNNINDKVIQAHLDQQHWAGIFPGYYINWGLLDFDNPPPSFIDKAIERLGLDEGQFIFCTSPSYALDGSVHLLYKPEYNGQPLTSGKYKKVMNHIPDIIEGKVECYPDQSRGIRLPFGAKQHLLNDGIPLLKLPWEEQLYWYEKVEPTDLSKIHNIDDTFIESVPSFPYSEPNTNNKSKGAFFFCEGLQDSNTRHNAIMDVVIWLFHQNYSPERAEELVRKWIETKHNNRSNTINKGDWKTVYRDIHNIIAWVYKKFERKRVYPDSVHNNYYAVYECDIDFIAKTFPGDISNQKKMFRLISYFRPRMKYDWVFCPQKMWIKIAGTNQYKEFQKELIRRSILEVNTSYWVKHYSKKFQLHLPNSTMTKLIQSDGRIITDFKEAVMKVYKTPRKVIGSLGLSKQTVYEWFR